MTPPLDVEVRVSIETAPSNGGHHVAVKVDGELLWWTGGETPEILALPEGAEIIVSVRVPRSNPSSTPVREVWKLRVERGQTCTLRVGPDGVERPLIRVDLQIVGAVKVGQIE
jgi:hypothetical protein